MILYKPMLNLLVFFYNTIPGADLGIAIILLTLIIRLILLPLSRKSIKAQKSLKTIQPKIDEVRDKYDDKEKQSKEMMKIYKKHKVNPFSSCLPLLIQLPILIAMFQVFRSGLSGPISADLYSFISDPGKLNSMAFGVLNLAEPSWILALVTAGLQYVQTKMMPSPNTSSKNGKKSGMAGMMGNQMKFVMPAITFFIGITLPSGLILYWLVTVIITILQNKYIKPDTPDKPDELQKSGIEKPDQTDNSKKDKENKETVEVEPDSIKK